MFKRGEETYGGGEGAETIIAQGVRVEGDFTSQGNVLIEGEVTGTVATAGDLRVGEHARIHADVKASNAVVAGKIRGNVFIENKLDLLETSEVQGDVSTQVLAVAPGAKVNGRVQMGVEEDADAESAAPTRTGRARRGVAAETEEETESEE